MTTSITNTEASSTDPVQQSSRITYATFDEARESARAHGYVSLRHAAKALGLTISQAAVYRPWEYQELYEEIMEELN